VGIEGRGGRGGRGGRAEGEGPRDQSMSAALVPLGKTTLK